MKLRTYLNDLTLRALVALQTFAATEPVRLRALLTSAVLAVGFLVPALANQNTAQAIASVGAVVLPIVVGETARSKVTPV
ncbi:hypothetical protein ACFW08_05825 [Streptomyces sp. NPDC058960]|uniref:hypothetical protein n=1 Tax=Streptomyces sp. NPDC058960 TaxID=3346679 RepID=UPI00369EAA47